MHPSSIQRLLVWVLLIALAAGCSLPMPAGVPVALSQTTQLAPIFYQAPANATPTPTPFQPMQPTSAVKPTQIPPTATLPPPPPPTLAPTAVPPQAPAQPAAEADNGRKKKSDGALGALQPAGQMNILVLGTDQRPGDVNFRTDTIILVTINPSLGTVSLTSFPRDLYLQIPNWGQERINTAWEYGGWKNVQDTFLINFGFRPDHFVLLNFAAFKRVVDSVGGLDVKVKDTVSDYRSGYWVTVPAGMVHMDADTALWYARTRKTTSDFARNRRQQEVLDALFEKMLSLNAVEKFPEFYAAYKDNVSTDLSLTDILGLLPTAAKIKDKSQIHSYYVGGDAAYDSITWGGAMVLIPRMDVIQGILRQALNIP